MDGKPMWKKQIPSIIVLISFLIVVWFMYPKLQARMGEAAMKGADEYHKKRLFGDAWKDV